MSRDTVVVILLAAVTAGCLVAAAERLEWTPALLFWTMLGAGAALEVLWLLLRLRDPGAFRR